MVNIRARAPACQVKGSETEADPCARFALLRRALDIDGQQFRIPSPHRPRALKRPPWFSLNADMTFTAERVSAMNQERIQNQARSAVVQTDSAFNMGKSRGTLLLTDGSSGDWSVPSVSGCSVPEVQMTRDSKAEVTLLRDHRRRSGYWMGPTYHLPAVDQLQGVRRSLEQRQRHHQQGRSRICLRCHP